MSPTSKYILSKTNDLHDQQQNTTSMQQALHENFMTNGKILPFA
jgi:hypothetical protein